MGTRLLIGFDLPVLDATVPSGDTIEVDELAEQPEEEVGRQVQAEREPGQAGREAVAATIAGLRRKGFARDSSTGPRWGSKMRIPRRCAIAPCCRWSSIACKSAPTICGSG